MILPTVTKDEAAKIFPDYKVVEVPSGKEYMRIASQPKWAMDEEEQRHWTLKH